MRNAFFTKKLFFVALLLFTGIHARSQVLMSLLLGDKINSGKLEFGLDGGWNVSNIGGLPGASTANRWNLGFYFDIKFKDPMWMFHTGVIVKSTMGSDGLPVYSLGDPALDAAFAGGKIDRRLSYFNVPFMMKRQFKSNLFVEGGFMMGLMNSSKDVFTQKVKDKDDLTYKIAIRDQYHAIDAGLIAGLGYRLMGGQGMNLGARYYYGMVDITKDNTTPNQYNRSLYIYVEIPIGKGKALEREKKKEEESSK